MKAILCGSMLMLLVTGAQAALPGDDAAGQRLHDANCTGCHDTSVYTRKDRKISSLDALRHQVAGCVHMAKKDFSPSQMQDLVKYLNDRFYHFQ